MKDIILIAVIFALEVILAYLGNLCDVIGWRKGKRISAIGAALVVVVFALSVIFK